MSKSGDGNRWHLGDICQTSPRRKLIWPLQLLRSALRLLLLGGEFLLERSLCLEVFKLVRADLVLAANCASAVEEDAHHETDEHARCRPVRAPR